MNKRIVVAALIFIFWPVANAQLETDPKVMFLEAESYFLFEEYKEALPTYLKLINLYPDNHNLNYRIGICYLNDLFQKSKGIEYLEKAVQHISTNYKENNFRETKAPPDAWFYLGNAYRINNQLDKAIGSYNKFKEIMDPEIYDLQLVDEQIQACRNAKRYELEPQDLDYINLGDNINSRFSDIHPVVSGDERSMVYVQEQQFYDAVFYSVKSGDAWQPPRNIMAELGYDEDIYPTSLSYDGTELYLYSNDNFLGTILVSRLVNGTWTKPTRLNENINTKYWESHACISGDGKVLYFTSNRKEGGIGGLDIYKSFRDSRGDWGPAINLGTVINTKYNEESPFITADGKVLYFSSYGHSSIGGYDVFFSSMLDNNSWSVPVNAGFPINTPDDDMFFLPARNGNFAYYSRYFENQGTGRLDIYRFEIYSSLHPRKFTLEGKISLKAAVGAGGESTMIGVYDKLKKDTIERLILPPGEQSFSLNLPAGEYEVIYHTNGYKTQSRSLLIPKDYRQGSQELSAELTPLDKPEKKLVHTEEQTRIVEKTMPSMTIRDGYITAQPDEEVVIDMLFDKAGKLNMKAFVDNKEVKSDKLDINTRKLGYKYKPLVGRNTLNFRFVDEDRHTTLKEVVIDCIPSAVIADTLNTILTDSIPTDLVDLRESLRSTASGNLKVFLDSIDLARDSIRTTGDLFNHLFNNVGKKGYTTNDLLELLVKRSSSLSAAELAKLLGTYATGNLKKLLSDPFLPIESMKTGSDLLNYLMNQAGERGYTPDNVIELLTSIAARDCKNTSEFLLKFRTAATGNLSGFLASVDLDALNLDSPGELVTYTIAEAAENGFTRDDVIDALLKMAGTNSVDEYRRKLLTVATGNLKKFLENIDLEKEGIKTNTDLLKYLFARAADNGFTAKDIWDIIFRLSGLKPGELAGINLDSIYTHQTKGWIARNLPLSIGIIAGFLLILLFLLRSRRKK